MQVHSPLKEFAAKGVGDLVWKEGKPEKGGFGAVVVFRTDERGWSVYLRACRNYAAEGRI